MVIGETNHQVAFLSAGWGVFILALSLSSARVYGRFVMTRHPDVDDYLMLLALLTSTAMMIAVTILTSLVLGRHSWNIVQGDFTKALHVHYAAVIFFILTIALTKVAILMQLAKIFRPFFKRALYWVCWGLIAFVLFWTVATTLCNILICGILGVKFWEMGTLTTQCSISTWTAQGVISIALDCILMILPLPIVWQLHIPLQQKSLAFALLAVGSIGCLFTIFRTVSLRTLKPSADPTYDHFRIPLWFTLEALITVCCGALMGSKQFVLYCFPSLNPKPNDILPPMQLDTTILDPQNSLNFIRLDNEDINKLHLESIMYRLAVIGSPWAQVPKDVPSAEATTELGVSTKIIAEGRQRPRIPCSTPSLPAPARKKKDRRKHFSLITQWTD